LRLLSTTGDEVIALLTEHRWPTALVSASAIAPQLSGTLIARH